MLRSSYGVQVARILLLSSRPLAALELLGHVVTVAPPTPDGLLVTDTCDVVLLAAEGRSLLPLLCDRGPVTPAGHPTPVLLLVSDDELSAPPEPLAAGFVLRSATPAELAARVRWTIARGSVVPDQAQPVEVGALVIDDQAWSARLHGVPLDLTYKEFELLRFLVAHPGRVLRRDELLAEVWGADYFGGTRTVDVHVRRLRAKLGGESAITTVRHVGYRWD